MYRIPKRGYKIRRWSAEDDLIIASMILAGKTYDDICAAFSPPAARGSIVYRVGVLARKGICPMPKVMI